MEKKGLFIPLTIFGLALLVMLIRTFSHLLVPGYFGFNAKRIVELTLFILVAAWIIVSRTQQENILALFFRLPALARWGLTTFFVLGVFSSFIAISSRYALLEVSIYALLLMMALYVATMKQRYMQLFDQGLMLAITAPLFFYICTSLHGYFHCNSYVKGFDFCQYVTRHTLPYFVDKRFAVSDYMLPGFVNLRFFSQLQTWTLPLIILPFAWCRKDFKLLRFFLFLFAGYWWALAFINQSRAILLLVPITVTLVVLLCYGRKSFKWLKLQVLTMMTGLLIFMTMFFSMLPDLIGLFERNMGRNEDRIILWKFTLNLIKKHPWLGVGPQNFSYFPNMYGAHPHNAILLIAVEWGIPAAIIGITLSIWGYFAWLKRSRVFLSKNNTMFVISLTATLTAGMVHSLVCGITIMPISQLFLVVIVGWVLGTYYPLSNNTEAGNVMTLISRGFLILFLLLTLMIVVVGIFPTVIHMVGESGRSPSVGFFMPRFWLLGQLHVHF